MLPLLVRLIIFLGVNFLKDLSKLWTIGRSLDCRSAIGAEGKERGKEKGLSFGLGKTNNLVVFSRSIETVLDR